MTNDQTVGRAWRVSRSLLQAWFGVWLLVAAAPSGVRAEDAGFRLIGRSPALPSSASAGDLIRPRLADLLVVPHGSETGFPTPTPMGVPGDFCTGAISILCGEGAAGTTTGKTFEAAPDCAKAGVVDAPGVWYRFTGTNQMVTASLCGSGYDNKLSVYTGMCGSLVCLDGFDDFCMLSSEVTWFGVSGVQYYILVHGYSGATGSYTINMTCGSPATPTPPPCCPGDADNSGGAVNANDFLTVQGNFGANNGVGGIGDADCSGGAVNANDFLAVQGNFGANCD